MAEVEIAHFIQRYNSKNQSVTVTNVPNLDCGGYIVKVGDPDETSTVNIQAHIVGVINMVKPQRVVLSGPHAEAERFANLVGAELVVMTDVPVVDIETVALVLEAEEAAAEPLEEELEEELTDEEWSELEDLTNPE
jgi:hypothetical protein